MTCSMVGGGGGGQAGNNGDLIACPSKHPPGLWERSMCSGEFLCLFSV